MKNWHHFFFIFLLAIISCSDQSIQTCGERLIEKALNNEFDIDVESISRLKDDRKTYYILTSTCCDQFNYLYDEHCNYLCAPSGGITGNGEGICPEFIGEVQADIIWQR